MNNWTRSDGRFNYYGLMPPVITAAPVNDFIRISWQDVYAGQAMYEVYELRPGDSWRFVAATALGATFYDNYTLENALMSFKVCARVAATQSTFSNIVTLRTPLCFWTDQNPVNTCTLDVLNIGGAGVVRVDWGDGLFNNYNGPNAAIIHGPYANPLQACVQLSGDVDLITDLTINAQVLNYGDLSRWVFPAGLLNLALTACIFTGNLSAWTLPAGLLTLNLTNNLFTGDLSRWFMVGMPATITSLIVITGNAFTGTIPAGIPAGTGMPAGLLTVTANGQGFSGDLKNFNLPAGAAPININFAGNNFTSLPRGNFRWCATLNFNQNNCSQDEIDDFLGAIDNCFTLGVVPLSNCTFTLDGVGMATPTGGMFNPAIISILAKYIAAAVIATFVIN